MCQQTEGKTSTNNKEMKKRAVVLIPLTRIQLLGQAESSSIIVLKGTTGAGDLLVHVLSELLY